MARAKKIDLTKIAEYRQKLGETQTEFWARFGVSQSCGSRYECVRSMPRPTAILIRLWMTGVIDEQALKVAAK